MTGGVAATARLALPNHVGPPRLYPSTRHAPAAPKADVSLAARVSRGPGAAMLERFFREGRRLLTSAVPGSARPPASRDDRPEPGRPLRREPRSQSSQLPLSSRLTERAGVRNHRHHRTSRTGKGRGERKSELGLSDGTTSQ